MAETNFDEFKGKDCRFVADWLKTERPTQALFRIIIIEEDFKTGIKAEDGLITLAKKCCLSLNGVKIWVSHLQKKKENRAKPVQKAKETRARKKQK